MTQAESRLSGQILDALRAQGFFAFKIHGGPTMMAGLPDIIVCVDGNFVGLETKMPEKRKNVSAIQKVVHNSIRIAGGTAEVVCGVKEALAVVDRVKAAHQGASISELIAELEDLRAHRGPHHERKVTDLIVGRQEGELNGLNMALNLLKGKL